MNLAMCTHSEFNGFIGPHVFSHVRVGTDKNKLALMMIRCGRNNSRAGARKKYEFKHADVCHPGMLYNPDGSSSMWVQTCMESKISRLSFRKPPHIIGFAYLLK